MSRYERTEAEFRHVEHFFEIGGQAVTVEQIVCTEADWDALGEGMLSGWSAVRCEGGEVLAIKINIAPGAPMAPRHTVAPSIN
jgi:hypothetical protein